MTIVKQDNPEAELKEHVRSNIRFYGTLMKASDDERGRFSAEIMQAVRANPKLMQADRNSLLFAIGEAAAAGLSVNPNLGECYLIPRNRSFKVGSTWKKVLEVNFQPGYKGLAKIAYRSGLISRLYTNVAYTGEHYVETGGCSPNIDHRPDHDKRTGKHSDIVVAYAVAWLKGSVEPMFETLGHKALVQIAERSGDPRKKDWSNVWTEHFEPMARKSAFIRLAKLLPRVDELRSLHLIAERDSMREVGLEPPRHEQLDSMQLPDNGNDGLNALVPQGQTGQAQPQAPAREAEVVEDAGGPPPYDDQGYDRDTGEVTDEDLEGII